MSGTTPDFYRNDRQGAQGFRINENSEPENLHNRRACFAIGSYCSPVQVLCWMRTDAVRVDRIIFLDENGQ